MAAQKTKVLITVDVEPSMAGGRPDLYRPVFDAAVIGEVGGRSEGLGFVVRTLRRHELAATFFVEALHPEYFGPAPMASRVSELLEAGQDVQVHAHPIWLHWRDGRPGHARRRSDYCARHSEDQLVRILERACTEVERWTGRTPVAFRAGGFSAGRALFGAMRRCGLKLSSNLCVAVRPPDEPELRPAGGLLRVEGVAELPVTCFRVPGPLGRGRYRPMQITSCSAAEMIDVLEQAAAAKSRYVVIVTHPFEFIKKRHPEYREIRRNRLVQARFESLCAHLDRRRDRFDVSTMAGLAREARLAEEPQPVLQGRTHLSLARAASNAVNDLLWVI